MKLTELNEQSEGENLTSFYISFSDLTVLLCVFFVMLLSMSKIDVGSFEKIKTSFSGSTEGTLVALASSIKEIVEGVPGVPGVSVELAEDGVRLNLDTATVFSTGSAKLNKSTLEPLKPVLNMVVKTTYTIDVEGHTDDVPLYRFYTFNEERMLETNWSLSGRRAGSVVHFLLDYGLDERRLRLVGYASTRPIKDPTENDLHSLEDIRAKNRRVSLLIK